jgi:hypothetical protein
MPLVFAGAAPSTALFIKEINSETKQMHPIHDALELFEEALYLSKPDVLFLFSATTTDDGVEQIFVQAPPSLTASLSLFGEFSTSSEWHGAPHIAAELLELASKMHATIKLSGAHTLDAASTAALTLFGKHLKHTHIVPITLHNASLATIATLGTLIHEYAATSSKRMSAVALGHLAATHTEEAPFGQLDTSTAFDANVRAMLTLGDTKALHHIAQKEHTKHHASIYAPLALLTSSCGSMPCLYHEYLYTTHAGIGYTVGSITLS